MSEFDKLPALVLGEAARTGGAIWTRIQQATKFYVTGYLQTLREIAIGVTKGEISARDAKLYEANARHLFMMAIAQASHATLVEVQKFINRVLNAVKDAINGALPVKIL